MWHSKDVKNTVKQVHKLGEQNNIHVFGWPSGNC